MRSLPEAFNGSRLKTTLLNDIESQVTERLQERNVKLAGEASEIDPDLLRVLKETSRTFYLPITRLPGKLDETVAAAYLCFRALDEIEDSIRLDNPSKVALLHRISRVLQTQTALDVSANFDFSGVFRSSKAELPEVTLRIGQWLSYPPREIAPRIRVTASIMADRMAYWVKCNWRIRTEADLDAYTYDVAGRVGVLLCDIWDWFTGMDDVDRVLATQFGRSLQLVNILRNRVEDMQRQIDFYPSGWRQEDMLNYAHNVLSQVKEEVTLIPTDLFRYFFEIPLLLAEATLDALENGKTKLTRKEVVQIISRLDRQRSERASLIGNSFS